MIGRPPVAPAARFWPRVRVEPSGCWIWTGYVEASGYGRFTLSHNHPVMAHRFAYQTTVGPIPEGLQLDHLCRRRSCVNPLHLDPVTCAENLLRGQTLTAANAAKTACPRGHLYTPENTVRASRAGGRTCRTCKRVRELAAYHRRRAEAQS